MQAWGFVNVEQVVEAALKSADMDVASVDFLVLHQVRRSKSPWVMPLYQSCWYHRSSSIQWGFWELLRPPLIAACGVRPAVEKTPSAE